MDTKKNPNVDISRNSSIYFAIGLNFMLFFTWQALEYKTIEHEPEAIENIRIEPDVQEDIPITKIEVALPPPPVAVSSSIQIVESTAEIVETIIESTESSQEIAIAPKSSNDGIIAVGDVNVEEVEEDVKVPFAIIEKVPVFPGCEGLSNQEAKACFQMKMMEHIKTNFKYPELALELGLQGRVNVVFEIDTKGKVTGIKSRGPDKNLEKEAERIVGLLPKMTPGEQRGVPVKVSYAVPIIFKYQD